MHSSKAPLHGHVNPHFRRDAGSLALPQPLKMEGKEDDLVDRVRRTEFFKPVIGRLDELLSRRVFLRSGAAAGGQIHEAWGRG